MTGSWSKNISGGALRKSMGDMADEINLTTDGTFKPEPATGGIIGALNLWRMYGYFYGTATSDGLYNNAPANCPFQLTSISNGRCQSWGNPISEIYLETLRYFASLHNLPSYEAILRVPPQQSLL